ncbi:MAG: ABC transporter ATP-binding protein [Alphaproteobacteria bacterium]|nr:ABC transporter ATP-binding protein [Alphaproteobacteria bacterium]
MTDAVTVHRLSKIYGRRRVVDGIDLTIPKGKIYGFLGPNGSGKTTTIRMICGLLKPDEGSGTCLGFDLLTQAEEIKKRVGYMTQRFSYWEDLTVRENLFFVADMFGVKNKRARIENVLESFGLHVYENHLAGTLSGGWKQRLALAACSVHDPDLLLLDEPTAGVDPQARREFWDVIHRLAESGITVLVSTHYMDEAERCHEVIYISYGRIVVQGTTDDVIAQAHLTTWRVEGKDVMSIKEKLKGHPAVTTLAPFGDALHISGSDARALEAALAPFRKTVGLTWTKEPSSLEDAFIYYMQRQDRQEG